VITGWAGIRGAFSLAAALAIPFTVWSGAPFPERDRILFLTFGVILVTLVLQGLTMPALIRRLGVKDDGSAKREENEARLRAAEAGLNRLEALAAEERGAAGDHRRLAPALHPAAPSPASPGGREAGCGGIRPSYNQS
jgi:monovalent cation/hydrogen antiporter